MIIAHPNSRNPRVEEDLTQTLHVYVREPPLEGKANEAVVEALAKHFKTQKNRVILIRGNKSKSKTFEIG